MVTSRASASSLAKYTVTTPGAKSMVSPGLALASTSRKLPVPLLPPLVTERVAAWALAASSAAARATPRRGSGHLLGKCRHGDRREGSVIMVWVR